MVTLVLLAACAPTPPGSGRGAIGGAQPAIGLGTPPVAPVEGDAGSPRAGPSVSVRVANPLPSPRPSETVVVALAQVRKLLPGVEAGNLLVTDEAQRPIVSQLVDMDGDEKPDELVFQSDFAPGEAKTFVLQPGPRRPTAREQFKVYGRFARERHDDFAWENDRIAHRMYGAALETWASEPLTSSGIDVWCKRTRKLVINDWYLTDNYHEDTGEGADLYSVGKSRGCGGTGIWADGKLHVSRNFVGTRVLANGPIRLVFELTYAPWNAGAFSVSEKKRVTLDAGKNFDRFESTFKIEGRDAPLALGIGIARHEGGSASVDKRAGTLVSWEPLKGHNGHLGCAVVTSRDKIVDYQQTATDSLLVTQASTTAPGVYYAGFAWDKSGDVADVAAWNKQVVAFAREIEAPLSLTLEAKPLVTQQRGTGAASWLSQMCETVMRRQPAGVGDRWEYDSGLVLRGFEQAWQKTKDRRYIDYVKRSIDRFVDPTGKIEGYAPENYNIDDINSGKVLFALHADASTAVEKERYARALHLLRSQMQTHPRTREGGFWHKRIYPHQMWLDGLYMASPFLAEFALRFHEPRLLDDVAMQILLVEKHTRDAKSGLLYHGWDESKQQRWANPTTGMSPQFWGRAMGWYAMAVVDVLDFLPNDHPDRPAVLNVLARLAASIAAAQDASTGVWWQVLDAGGREKNYREASASAMFVYAIAKAVRRGWLDQRAYEPVARRGYQGIVDQFVEVDQQGQVNLKSVCKVAGLGGNPYRDGSYEYYTSTEVVANDPKGVGAFVLASVEVAGLARE
ncbi:MAG TPA: glycoside hydrolase family 88 protein [Polyangiaceae bacterium]|nr:glycoside hydrolase family 88 protein [Polyangiaceae bacterium]